MISNYELRRQVVRAGLLLLAFIVLAGAVAWLR